MPAYRFTLSHVLSINQSFSFIDRMYPGLILAMVYHLSKLWQAMSFTFTQILLFGFSHILYPHKSTNEICIFMFHWVLNFENLICIYENGTCRWWSVHIGGPADPIYSNVMVWKICECELSRNTHNYVTLSVLIDYIYTTQFNFKFGTCIIKIVTASNYNPPTVSLRSGGRSLMVKCRLFQVSLIISYNMRSYSDMWGYYDYV